MKKTIAAVLAVSLLAGCATRPKDIAPAYVSPVLYQNLSCNQLRAEAQTISQRAAVATGAQEKKASQDAAMTGVGLIIFWPALLFMSGDGAPASDVARIKGEMQAIQDVSTAKKCGIQFAPAAA